MTIITRFPPSPTGFLHIGSLRTALYNYAFARQNKGKFIVRIEDTDRERYVEGAVENLLKTLSWAGFDFDEGPGKEGSHRPYIQSERLDIYKKHAKELLENGHAYRCFCSKERLETMRKEQELKHLAPKYDRFCLDLKESETEENLKKQLPYVIRQKIPRGKIVRFTDIIRGPIEVNSDTLDDQVLLKSDGYPTYHLANIVDDHLMEITHVIKGEEWLPSTPKHILLYEAFSWNPPFFAHLPLLLNQDRSKLSKRQGDVAVEDYIQKGYLKEALVNFVALLGWHPEEDNEILSLADIIKKFDLSRVQKSGAVCNFEKLEWFNGYYIRTLSDENLANQLEPFLKNEPWYEANKNEISRYLPLIKERMKTLLDAKNMLKYFFVDDFEYDLTLFENPKMKVDKNIALQSLKATLENLKTHTELKDLRREEIKEEKDKSLAKLLDLCAFWCGKTGLSKGQVLWPIRVALTNEPFSPGVFELIMTIGKEKTMQRIQNAIMALKKNLGTIEKTN